MSRAQGTPLEPPASLLAEAWEEARIILSTYLRYTIDPAELIERQAITPLFRAQLLRWLRPLEAIVRLLLLTMAKAMHVEPITRRAYAKRTSVRPDFIPRFNWAMRRKAKAPATDEAEKPPKTPRRWARVVVASKGIAERLEGVARVIENPERYAKRLARRLQARPDEVPLPIEEEPPEPIADIPLRDLWRELHDYVRKLFKRNADEDPQTPLGEAQPPPRDDSS
ncbi:MAG: hypothetical protein AB7L26_03505 [Hyphomonadaceae bacterium]